MVKTQVFIVKTELQHIQLQLEISSFEIDTRSNKKTWVTFWPRVNNWKLLHTCDILSCSISNYLIKRQRERHNDNQYQIIQNNFSNWIIVFQKKLCCHWNILCLVSVVIFSTFVNNISGKVENHDFCLTICIVLR